jgi:3-phenylpropionate/trans-cinnamate dioxygenase ferredoxin reductase subunit
MADMKRDKSMETVVIVGAGQAGAALAVSLREFGFAGAIEILGNEAHPPYERPELSKGYVSETVGFDALVALDPEKAKELDISLRLSCDVLEIDRVGNRVRTETGWIGYDHLILATGGQARRLPLPEALAQKAFAIRTRDDADAIRARLTDAASVVVIGGGWLGTEAAVTARSFGAKVDLIETAPRLCARVAPVWLSERLAEIQTEAGVTLHLGEVPSFGEDGSIQIGETRLMPDLVIEAIGMMAHDRLAREAGLECADGIVVDAQNQTGDPKIYAIGDCARGADGMRRESWQYANQSAQNVAAQLTAQPRQKPEPRWFWSVQGKSRVQMLGDCPEGATQFLRRAGKGESCLFLSGATLVGCIAIDNPRDIAEARKVMSSRQALDLDLISDPKIPLSKALVDAREVLANYQT